MMTVYVKAETVLDQVRWEMKSAKAIRSDERMGRLRRLEGMFGLVNLDEKVAVDEELYDFINL